VVSSPKSVFIFFCSALLCIFFSLSPHESALLSLMFQDNIVDQSLVRQHVAELAPSESGEILELLFRSYRRSQSTLHVQEAAFIAFGQMWQGWHNVLHTRRNPSRTLPQRYNVQESKIRIDAFHDAYAQYEQTNAQYAEFLNALVAKTKNESPAVYSQIQEIRSQARRVITQAVLDSLIKIRELIKNSKNRITQAAERFQSQPGLKYATKLPDFLWDYIPSAFLMRSFVHFDDDYTKMSTGCFEAFMYSQEMNAMIWEIIERARAAFYAEQYKALYYKMEDAGCSMTGFVTPSQMLDTAVYAN